MAKRKKKTNVYILHFAEKLGHAQHYVGCSKDPEARLEQHRATRWVPLDEPEGLKCGRKVGGGANLLAYLNSKGITYEIARIFPKVPRAFERALKNTNHTARYCPICNPNAPEYHPKGILA